MKTHNKDEILDILINRQFKEDYKRTIDDLIRYGRHLNKVRKETDKEVISGEEMVRYLITHGLPIDLAVQIIGVINNPDADYTFLYDKERS